MNDTDQLKNILDPVIKHVGLGNFQMSLERSIDGFQRNLTVVLVRKFAIEPKYLDDRTQVIDSIINPIVADIETSVLVQQNMEAVNKAYKKMSESLALAEEKIAELLKYKLHYDLEMTMRHGVPNESP